LSKTASDTRSKPCARIERLRATRGDFVPAQPGVLELLAERITEGREQRIVVLEAEGDDALARARRPRRSQGLRDLSSGTFSVLSTP
jgi:hypothetical protein